MEEASLSSLRHQHLGRTLENVSNGTLSGPDELIQAFYPELKRLAASKMRRESAEHSWQPTVLVNELYLELVKVKALRPVRPSDQNEKSAFFALAGTYNNRALVLLDQEQYEPALAYSEKALAILTVTLKNQPKALEPFLNDNRKIREKLGQPAMSIRKERFR